MTGDARVLRTIDLWPASDKVTYVPNSGIGRVKRDNIVAVYRGMATYTSPSNHPGTFLQEYVVTNVGGQEILQQYFVDLFYCPWFRTWDEALAADFNCTFAPQ